jgi:hypothetical protein
MSNPASYNPHIGQPVCSYCGGLHFGSSLGKCVYQCERCERDTREDAEGFGHRKCECAPLPPVVWPTVQAKYEIRIANLDRIRLTQIQWDDLRNTIAEHQRNGFRDGWCRMGSTHIVEIGVRCGIGRDEPAAEPREP